jgi:hypothetical protein
MVVTTKNTVFWNVTLCGSCTNRCFGGTYRSIFQLLVTAKAVPSSWICSSVTLFLTRTTQRQIPEDSILQAANHYDSDKSGSLHATAQGKSTCLNIFTFSIDADLLFSQFTLKFQKAVYAHCLSTMYDQCDVLVDVARQSEGELLVGRCLRDLRSIQSVKRG